MKKGKGPKKCGPFKKMFKKMLAQYKCVSGRSNSKCNNVQFSFFRKQNGKCNET